MHRRQIELARIISLRDYDVLSLQETYARAEVVSLPGLIGYSRPTQCALAECSSAPCYDVALQLGKPHERLYTRGTVAHALVPAQEFCSTTPQCVHPTEHINDVATYVASVYLRPVIAASGAFVPHLAGTLARDHALYGDFNAHHVSWVCHTQMHAVGTFAMRSARSVFWYGTLVKPPSSVAAQRRLC
ncbi:hypothetical protein MRX96_041229 [Rhipicephalus microplus]